MFRDDTGKKVDEDWKRQAQKEKEQLSEADRQTRREKAALQPLEANFFNFVSGLVTEALIHLGVIQNPMTQSKEINLDLAKYTIDVLVMLQEKTRGNLTPQEENFLKQTIYDLQMRFVDAVRK